MLAMCIAVLVIVGLAAIPRARASLQERRIYARQREIAMMRGRAQVPRELTPRRVA